MKRTLDTPYIEWAKLQPPATLNLAVSGMPHVTFDDFGGAPDDLPLAGNNAYGYAPLLEAISTRYDVRPSQVMTTTGCSMANFVALAALVAPGDEVLIEQPTYEPLVRVAEHLGANIQRFGRPAEEDCRLMPERVLAKVTPRTRVIVIANLHNPSSQHVPDSVLFEIGEAAARVGARVLVDEVYLDAVFDGSARSSVHLGPAFIATSSLTKVYGLAALRCGWILADESFLHRAWRLADLYGNTQPFITEWLAARAFAHLATLHARTQQLLQVNRQLFEEWARVREDVGYVQTGWGTTAMLRPRVTDAQTLCRELRQVHDVSVVPGDFFEAPDYVRVGLSVPSHILSEGLTRIDACLRSFTPA